MNPPNAAVTSWSKFQETIMNAMASSFLYAFRPLGALLFRKELREVIELTGSKSNYNANRFFSLVGSGFDHC